MKKYHIENCGCDDSTDFDIELTDDELKTVIRLFEENNKASKYGCQPVAYIYEYREDNKYYGENRKPLNKYFYEEEIEYETF